MIGKQTRVGKYKRYNEKQKISLGFKAIFLLVILGFFLFSLIFKFGIFVTIFFTMLVMAVNYYTNMLTIRLDLGIELFFSMLATRLFGLFYGFIVILLGMLFTDLYTGRFDKDTLISLVFNSLIIIILSILPKINFVVIAAILVVVKLAIGLLILIPIGIDPEEIIFEWGVGFVVNLFLVLGFGSLFIGLFS